MKLAVLHSRLNPVLTEAVERLRARGVRVDLVGPGALGRVELTSLRPQHDLHYLKTSAEPWLSYAGALHAAGAATINPYPQVAELSNKLVAAVALRRAGLPAPETWLATRDGALDDLLRAGPLVLKPPRGSRGRGVRVVRRRSELEAAVAPSGEPAEGHAPVLVQRYHPSDDGRDHKLYCIGERVFGVRRRGQAFDGWEEKALASEPFAPERSLCELALRCGRALSLSLFGLDVVVSGGAPWIVDVNKCAGFVGATGAAEALCEHLVAAVRERAGR